MTEPHDRVDDRRARVLMLIPQLGYGGAEGAFLRVAGFLARHADVTVGLMAPDYGGSHYSSAGSTTDLPVVILDDQQEGGTGYRRGVRRWWRMARRVRSLKREHDVAISFLSGANLLNALAGFPSKTVVSERGSKRHDTDMSPMQRFLWTRLLDPWVYRRATHVVAASGGLAAEISSANPHASARVMALEGTLHSAELIDGADATVEDDVAGLASYETVVAFGRLHRQKGFDFLIRAFAVVRRRREKARLLIIGDGPEIGSLKRLAEELGLKAGGGGDEGEADVIFAGYRSAPLRFVRIGKVFAFPSRAEGRPTALMVALASGVAILAADCPWGPRSVLAGKEEAVTDESIGFPTPLAYGTLMPLPEYPGAVEIWASELARLLEAQPTRRSLKQRQEAVRRFDIEVTGPRWLELVDRSVQARKRSNEFSLAKKLGAG